jgi:hypothetical protein
VLVYLCGVIQEKKMKHKWTRELDELANDVMATSKNPYLRNDINHLDGIMHRFAIRSTAIPAFVEGKQLYQALIYPIDDEHAAYYTISGNTISPSPSIRNPQVDSLLYAGSELLKDIVNIVNTADTNEEIIFGIDAILIVFNHLKWVDLRAVSAVISKADWTIRYNLRDNPDINFRPLYNKVHEFINRVNEIIDKDMPAMLKLTPNYTEIYNKVQKLNEFVHDLPSGQSILAPSPPPPPPPSLPPQEPANLRQSYPWWKNSLVLKSAATLGATAATLAGTAYLGKSLVSRLYTPTPSITPPTPLPSPPPINVGFWSRMFGFAKELPANIINTIRANPGLIASTAGVLGLASLYKYKSKKQQQYKPTRQSLKSKPIVKKKSRATAISHKTASLRKG